MMYNQDFFDRGVDRRGTDSIKWGLREVLPENGIPLWVADMDFACAAPIQEALIARAQHPAYGYALVTEQSQQAVANFWQRRHQVTISPQQMLMLPSVVSGLRACAAALTKEGGRVLILTPVYGPFYAAIRDSGRTLVESALVRDETNRYHIDFADVEKKLQQGIDLMMICNPHNPLSRVWQQEELQRISDLCKQYNTLLASDEIHCDFVYQPHAFTSILALPDIAPTTVCMSAASKTFNIAGLKQSTLFCRDEQTLSTLARHLEAAGAESGNIFAMAATEAAYTGCDDWLDALLSYLSGNRAIVYHMMQKLLPQAKITPIEATFLAWVDVSMYENDNELLEQRCYQHGVALTSGTFFGETTGKGFMRINFGCPRHQLEEGLTRFAAAVLNQ